MKETRESHRSAREGFEARLISAADTRLQANAPSFSADGHACRWQRGGEALGSRPSPHAHNLLEAPARPMRREPGPCSQRIRASQLSHESSVAGAFPFGAFYET